MFSAAWWWRVVSADRSRGIVTSLIAEHDGDRAAAFAAEHSACAASPGLAALDSHAHDREYGRHNGHADLLREAIDGQTGE